MADITFNTTSGAPIARELMIAYLNTGTDSTPVWSPIGKRVPDSSIEMEWERESEKDILGNTFSTLKKPTQTQTFDAWNIENGDAAALKIWNIAVKDQDATQMAAQDMLIVHFYAGTASTPFAERYKGCALEISGFGGTGGGNLEMPLTVTYGGERIVGTASKNASTGAITFTPAT